MRVAVGLQERKGIKIGSALDCKVWVRIKTMIRIGIMVRIRIEISVVKICFSSASVKRPDPYPFGYTDEPIFVVYDKCSNAGICNHPSFIRYLRSNHVPHPLHGIKKTPFLGVKWCLMQESPTCSALWMKSVPHINILWEMCFCAVEQSIARNLVKIAKLVYIITTIM